MLSTFRGRRALVLGALALPVGCARRGAGDDGIETVNPDLVPVSDEDPTRGPRGGKKRIVVFADFECPFCKQASRDIEAVRAEIPGVSVVFKQRPLKMHPRARALADFSAAAFFAGGDDVFWRVHDRLMAMETAPTDEDLLRFAESFGIAAKLPEVAKRALQKVDDDVALAKSLAIKYTPHLFVGRKSIDGLLPFETFRALASSELAS